MHHPPVSGAALIVRHTGKVFALPTSPSMIGRQADNAIVISDPQVSRHHATISRQLDAYVVQDLGSANGTYVNGQRIRGPRALRHGDTLQVGSTLLDVTLLPSGAGTKKVPVVPPPPSGPPSSAVVPIALAVVLGTVLVACLVSILVIVLTGLGQRPTVFIQAPLPGAELVVGDKVLLQSMATGTRNITRLELSVDGVLVGGVTSPDPDGRASLSASELWTFDQTGTHTISAVAYTAKGISSRPVSVSVIVVDSTAPAAPTTNPPVPPTMVPIIPPPPSPIPPTASPTAVPAAPSIEYFRAEPDRLLGGACAALQWGAVSHATQAVIDQGIGGVGTPGSSTVCPDQTTTYKLTASGPGGTTMASVTITVDAP
jgi:pSer/pThr/pTyr-binding forkhead associated (FHA) protein